MKKYRFNKHSIDLLFPFSLFFVFAITSLYVTMAGAALYENMMERTSSDYAVFTPISYLEQKIRRYDKTGGISIQEISGTDVLCLHEFLDDSAYTTYIYTLDGNLMELFVSDDASVSLENGTVLMDAGVLSFQQKEGQLLNIVFTGKDGASETLTLHVKAEGGLTL